jgi:hypothetical protein
MPPYLAARSPAPAARILYPHEVLQRSSQTTKARKRAI